jgi:hypothetical protein
MSHVVTSYHWAWKILGGIEYDGNPGIDMMNWIGEMSEKGWELKGLTNHVLPTTQQNATGGRTDVWAATYTAFMQRPAQTAVAMESWNYPD